MTTDITQKIIDLATPLAEEKGLYVLDAEIKAAGAEVWVYLEADDRGVNLNECAKISNELGFLIEAHEVFDRKYRLNVSSPGLSRPLSDKRQYRKNEGRLASVKYKSSDDYLTVDGIITKVRDEDVVITDENEKEHSISFDAIVETKIIPVI